MPTPSSYPTFELPSVDLFDFIFSTGDDDRNEDDYAEKRMIYYQADGSRQYTFAEVRDGARCFGESLRQQWGWHCGDVLAVIAPNDVDYSIAVFGVLYAGGVVLPLNPMYSDHELAHMLQDAGAKALVVHESLLLVAQRAAALSNISKDKQLLLGPVTKHMTHPMHICDFLRQRPAVLTGKALISPHKDLAFVVYSSGTTSLPKGVMLSHRNIVADLLMIRHSVGSNYNKQQDSILGVLPFYHIYGLTGLLLQALHRRIKLVVMPKFTLEEFCRAIQDYKVSLTYVAPPVLVQLTRSQLPLRYDLSSLRMITCGAAPLGRELVAEVYSKLKLRVNQAYGLSETSPMTHTQPWTDWWSSVGSVGRLFPNMIVKYLSVDGSEVTLGRPGEVCVQGPNVFMGYWRNEEATRGAFTEDGFFKTGDVGYEDGHQNLYISDRVKELIKWNGFQIAPAELEGLLLDCPLVADVAVVGVYLQDQHTEAPRAYVVLKESINASKATANAIHDWLNTRIVYYKHLRGGIRFTDTIPKSEAGKILRRVLKELAAGRSVDDKKSRL